MKLGSHFIVITPRYKPDIDTDFGTLLHIRCFCLFDGVFVFLPFNHSRRGFDNLYSKARLAAHVVIHSGSVLSHNSSLVCSLPQPRVNTVADNPCHVDQKVHYAA
jgi:hypothetical protein